MNGYLNYNYSITKPLGPTSVFRLEGSNQLITSGVVVNTFTGQIHIERNKQKTMNTYSKNLDNHFHVGTSDKIQDNNNIL